MSVLEPLPLPLEALPEGIRRFAKADAPGPAKMMAARGVAPVKGADLVALLLQLSASSEQGIASTANKTLTDLPMAVLSGACAAEFHPSLLHGLAEHFSSRDELLELLVRNPQVADETLTTIAKAASETVAELIAVNQQRLLSAPKVIEALYHNKNTLMSTADRLVELAVRNEVELTGIRAFKEHAEAIRGQLIPEPDDEPLPDDEFFRAAQAQDADDADVLEKDETEGTETVKSKYVPLRQQISGMSISGKIRLAEMGNKAARQLLVREPRRIVAMAAVRNMNEGEAAQTAASKEVGDDVLRFIGTKREWLSHYDVKRNLVNNPRTPTGIALRFVPHMRDNDLRSIARSRNVPVPIKNAAKQRWERKQKGRK